MAMNETHSNIITPPDFLDNDLKSVLVIDPEWSEIEDLALVLKASPKAYNVYVYLAGMDKVEWLEEAARKADTVIVNTIETDISHIKDRIAVKLSSYYFGPKNFLMNPNRIERPIDYFLPAKIAN